MLRLGYLSVVAATVLVTACGGEGGDIPEVLKGNDTFTNEESVTPAPGEGIIPGAFSHNGIYVNHDHLSVMLIDSTREQYPVVYANFATDGVIILDSATTTSNRMIGTGMTLTNADDELVYDETIQTNIDFANNKAVASVPTVSNVTTETLTKTDASLAIEKLLGTHENPDDGSTWNIYPDGGFVVNGFCTIAGNFERKGNYYSVTMAEATQCGDSDFNGKYEQGVLITVKHDGVNYLVGVMGRTGQLQWGYAPMY